MYLYRKKRNQQWSDRIWGALLALIGLALASYFSSMAIIHYYTDPSVMHLSKVMF